MADNLRKLLIQRAARLQERPALTSGAWGTLSYGQFRNRVEGVALGLMADDAPTGAAIFCDTEGPWDWACEVAAACCGLRWDRAGARVAPDILGGPGFNDEHGRGPYHEREHEVQEDTLFAGNLDHAAMLLRLQRLNRTLGWDHDTRVDLPLAGLGEAPLRAALWSALYAGAHAAIGEADPEQTGLLARFRRPKAPWDPAPFAGFWAI